jgi:hypothetical protein
MRKNANANERAVPPRSLSGIMSDMARTESDTLTAQSSRLAVAFHRAPSRRIGRRAPWHLARAPHPVSVGRHDAVPRQGRAR